MRPPSKSKIGPYTLISTHRLVIYEGNDGWVVTEHRGVKINLRFTMETVPDKDSALVFGGAGDHAFFRFTNWKSSVPSGTPEPAKLATLPDGVSIFGITLGVKTGPLILIDLMVMDDASELRTSALKNNPAEAKK